MNEYPINCLYPKVAVITFELFMGVTSALLGVVRTYQHTQILTSPTASPMVTHTQTLTPSMAHLFPSKVVHTAENPTVKPDQAGVTLSPSSGRAFHLRSKKTHIGTHP